MRDTGNIYRILVGKSHAEYHLEDQDRCGGIIFKCSCGK
jgi:hypothetical protein